MKIMNANDVEKALQLSLMGLSNSTTDRNTTYRSTISCTKRAKRTKHKKTAKKQRILMRKRG